MPPRRADGHAAAGIGGVDRADQPGDDGRHRGVVLSIPISAIQQPDNRALVQRAVHRLIGCLIGALAGLACLAFVGDDFLLWIALIPPGIWLCSQIQTGTTGITYVGMQAMFAYLMSLRPGPGFAGIDQPRPRPAGRGHGRRVDPGRRQPGPVADPALPPSSPRYRRRRLMQFLGQIENDLLPPLRGRVSLRGAQRRSNADETT